MTDRRFVYDEQLLECCAHSPVAQFVNDDRRSAGDAGFASYSSFFGSSSTSTSTSTSTTAEINHQNDKEDSCCVDLFQQHSQHYGRQHTQAESFLRQIPRDDFDATTTTTAWQHYDYELGQRMEAFLRSVVFVHQHNWVAGASGARQEKPALEQQHFVTLNRFSDLYLNEVLSSLSTAAEQKPRPTTKIEPVNDLWSELARRRMEQSVGGSARSIFYDDDQMLRNSASTTSTSVNHGITVMLSTPEQIMHVAANLTIGKGSMNKLYKYRKEKKENAQTYDLYPVTIDIPTDNQLNAYDGNPPDFAVTPALTPDMDGALLSIKHNKDVPKVDQRKNKKTNKKQKDDSSFVEDATKVVDNNENHEDLQTFDKKFRKHLNWATTNNPDGVPIVHDAFDQGTCGSCWAFSAAGSLEASAARREAHKAYQEYVPPDVDGDDDDDDSSSSGSHHHQHHEQAIQYAQDVELRAFQMLNLSVQELLDCDTAADQGCTGGNPLLSFYFIHRYGLTSWEKYPYVGFEDKCKTKLVKHPVATVKSWGLISPNHENHMELALRHIGPIAVGFNGADPAFLSYRGGIFDLPHCKQGANHALLITGYGEKKSRDPNTKHTVTTKYWIARNSWGTGWGLNGYVWIKRRDGKKGTPGLCGIARSPSVALDGILLKHLKSLHQQVRGGGIVNEGDRSSSDDDSISIEQMHNYNVIEDMCIRSGLGLEGTCGSFGSWVSGNTALSFGMIGIALALLAAWPLTLDYRRRRRRRRIRDQRRLEESQRASQDKIMEEAVPQESAPLMAGSAGNSNGAGYGATSASSS